MGSYVHLHVCFACDENDAVAALAAPHLDAAPPATDDMPEVRWFLESLAARRGSNDGTKGGLAFWGMIGNHTDVGRFCELLRPFWEELLNGVPNGPHPFERVVVFEEREGSDAATAYQIGWDNDDNPGRQMRIERHDRLPFAWGRSSTRSSSHRRGRPVWKRPVHHRCYRPCWLQGSSLRRATATPPRSGSGARSGEPAGGARSAPRAGAASRRRCGGWRGPGWRCLP